MTVQGPLLLPPGSYTKKEMGKASCAVRHKRILKHLCMVNETLIKFKPQKLLQFPGTFLSFLPCYFLSCSPSRCKAWSQARCSVFLYLSLLPDLGVRKVINEICCCISLGLNSHTVPPFPFYVLKIWILIVYVHYWEWKINDGTKSGRPHLSHWEAREPLPGM